MVQVTRVMFEKGKRLLVTPPSAYRVTKNSGNLYETDAFDTLAPFFYGFNGG